MRYVTCSVVTVPWHSSHSGYHQLLRYLPEARVLLPPHTPGGMLAAAAGHRLASWCCPLPFYPPQHFATDVAALVRRGPLHVLYADEQLWFSRHRRGVTAATFHQPPTLLGDRFDRATWRSFVRAVDHVIAVDPAQRDFFSELMPYTRVHLVPHGIDTDVFVPATEQAVATQRRPVVLTVGWWLRDFALLDVVHDLLHKRYGSDLQLVVVTRDRASRDWHPAVTVLENIGEAELLGWYRAAAVLALPLTDATANNTLLEAMACGTPVVATDVGGVSFYTGDSPAAILMPPGDADAMATGIEQILAESGTLAHTKRAQLAVDRAAAFAWPMVAEMTRAVHRLLEH